jgi:hypothetical protein
LQSRAGFEHGSSRWEALVEQKVMEVSGRGFKMIEKRKILMPHPLKRYFRGRVCYKERTNILVNFEILGKDVVRITVGIYFSPYPSY